MTEIWKIIDGYETYSVSDLGNVRNDATGRIMKSQKHNQGYLLVGLCKKKNQKNFLVHRLIALAFIENPENKKCVDHIDGIVNNNNLNNLRWATVAENSMNKKKDIDNTSGTKGVHFHKRDNKWIAKITINSKQIHLGTFNTMEEAIAARQAKANELFGEFINDCEKI